MVEVSSRSTGDRRTRRTRRQLQNALLDLLEDEPLSKLTVSQIAARADVSRQAFYLHFRSKEELLLSHVDDAFAEIRAISLRSGKRSAGLQELLATTFDEWFKRTRSLQLALQTQDKDQVIDRIRLQVADLIAACAQQGHFDILATPINDYTIDYIAGGVYMLMRSWNRDGLTSSPQQMAELTFNLITGRVLTPHSAAPRTH